MPRCEHTVCIERLIRIDKVQMIEKRLKKPTIYQSFRGAVYTVRRSNSREIIIAD